jgi:hypothetical protein
MPGREGKMRKWFVRVAIVGWLLCVFLGLRTLWNYALSAGDAALAPLQMPRVDVIRRQPGRATLILFVHPHCPCSRATVSELSVITTHSKNRLNAYVLFMLPPGYPENWARTDLWRNAATIPGVVTVVDKNAHYARLFNAATSGQVMLYAPNGRLLFKGGITRSRGHEGDNSGRRQIIALLKQESSGSRETSVFGCPLFSKQQNSNFRTQQCKR